MNSLPVSSMLDMVSGCCTNVTRNNNNAGTRLAWNEWLGFDVKAEHTRAAKMAIPRASTPWFDDASIALSSTAACQKSGVSLHHRFLKAT